MPVRVGSVTIGGGAPVAVQSMTCYRYVTRSCHGSPMRRPVEGGSDLLRVTVNTDAAARSVPEIKERMLEAGCDAPLIGDFHYNGHLLLTRHPACAEALDKYRVNPGNVGPGGKHDENFAVFCAVASELNKPLRIGVNSGSIDEALVLREMGRHDADGNRNATTNRCMVEFGPRLHRPRPVPGSSGGPDRHLLQGLTASGSSLDLQRARPEHSTATPSRPHRSWFRGSRSHVVSRAPRDSPQRTSRRHRSSLFDDGSGR